MGDRPFDAISLVDTSVASFLVQVELRRIKLFHFRIQYGMTRVSWVRIDDLLAETIEGIEFLWPHLNRSDPTISVKIMDHVLIKLFGRPCAISFLTIRSTD